MFTGVSKFLYPRTKTWTETQGEQQKQRQFMEKQEQKGARAGRKFRGLPENTVQTAGSFISWALGSFPQHAPFLFMLYLLRVGLGGNEPPVSVPTVSLIC